MHADGAVPPGPGKPLTIIDTGVDLTHEEFAGRPFTTALNRQSTSGQNEEHGTAVASVAAAPRNHLGVVGVYPQANLYFWDASPSGTRDHGGRRHPRPRRRDPRRPGRRQPQPRLRDQEPADRPDGRGHASRGHPRRRRGGEQPPEREPARVPGQPPACPDRRRRSTRTACRRSSRPALRTSTCRRPASASGSRFRRRSTRRTTTTSSTARASPRRWSRPRPTGSGRVRPTLNASQVFDVMRASAQDVWTPGFDPFSGFGRLDIPAALTTAPPPQRSAGAERGRLVRQAGRDPAPGDRAAHLGRAQERQHRRAPRPRRRPARRVPVLGAGPARRPRSRSSPATATSTSRSGGRRP